MVPAAFERVDAKPREDQAEFIHQRDVDVALRVLDDLGRFSDLDAAGLVCSGGDDLPIQGIDGIGHSWRAATGDFLDAR